MSNYTKTTNFAAKDSLPSGNAAKIVKGTEIDTEFNNIETASATKADSNNSTLTGTTAFETLSDGTISITAFVDEDNMASDSAALVPTQQSVKAYVDSQVTAQDLDFQADTGGALSIDLDSETLTLTGGTGVDTSGSGNAVTFAIDSTVATLAGTQTLTNKTLTSPTLNTPTIGTSFTIGSATITEAELEILDGATVTTAELNVLDGITSTTAELNILDGVTSTAAELNILDGVTSTAAELNILDGVTSTTAELNILDGVTSTASELNILDGVTSTAAELNILDGVTATTAEINYVDGVTSNVQTQLNTKAPIDGATFTGTTTIPTADINGGAIDGTVIGGSSAAAGSFTTLGASGAITGTLGTAAQTNITSVGTLGSLTVSGDVTVDTNSLKVDSTNNRVGILNASPDVTLDIGSATDSIHIPVGTTAQRPGSPAAGYFRYNSTLSQFEGYTDAWGAIGGGGGSNLVVDTMTGDGSDTTLTLSNDPLNENNTQVYIDGVYQNKDTYSVSGTTLTFSTAPPSGSAVEAMTIQPTAVNVPADASVTSAKLSGDLVTPGALNVTTGLTVDTTTLVVDAGNNRVGIGISSPTTALDVAGSVRLKTGATGTPVIVSTGSDTQGTLRFGSSGNEYSINGGADYLAMIFNTNGAEAMRILSNQRVSIGGSSSNHLLNVTSSTTPALEFTRGSGNATIGIDNGNSIAVGGTAGDLVLRASGTTGVTKFTDSGGNITMTLTEDNNVGIGMTPPSDRNLAVYDSTNSIISLHNSTTGTAASDGLQLQLVSDDGYLVNYEAGGMVAFYTAPSGGSTTERMRIDSSGNLLVGTTDVDLGFTDGDSGFAVNPAGYIQAARDSANAILYLNKLNNDGTIIQMHKDGTTVGSISCGNSGAYIYFGSSAESVGLGYGGGFVFPTNGVTSGSDNSKDLGSPSYRWDDIYATNGTIQTSDRNEKQDIEALSDAEQRVAVACKGLLRKFRWKDSVAEKGDDARIHFGIIAQDLQDAFTAEGLDAGRYAMFISSTWTDEETGEERSRMGVRYSELLAFIISAI